MLINLVGRTKFDHEASPCPHLTLPVNPGDRFELMEAINMEKDLNINSKKWVLARPIQTDGQPVPIRGLAGSLKLGLYNHRK